MWYVYTSASVLNQDPVPTDFGWNINVNNLSLQQDPCMHELPGDINIICFYKKSGTKQTKCYKNNVILHITL